MVFRHFVAATILLAIPVGLAYAQAQCTELLRAGINNHYTNYSDLRSRDYFFSNLCSRYDRTVKQNKDFGSETFSAYGYNNLTLSSHDAETVASAMCDTKNTENEMSQLRSTLSTVVSPDALAAWTQCLDLDSNKLRIEPTFANTALGFGGHSQLTVSAMSKVIGGDGPGPLINRIKPNGFTCYGSLMDVVGQRLAVNRTYGLACDRHTAAAPFSDGGNLVYAKAHTVYIDTSAGVITLSEPAILAGPSVLELDAKIRALETRLAALSGFAEKTEEYGFSSTEGVASCDAKKGEVVIGVRIGDSRNARVTCAKITVK